LYFFFSCYGYHRDLPSFPTRRSSDLFGPRVADDLELYWNQQLLDVLLEYPIKSQVSQFSIHPRVDRYGLRVTTNLIGYSSSTSRDRKSTRLNSSHVEISYAVFCLKKK